MKKILVASLALGLGFSLTSCDSSNNKNSISFNNMYNFSAISGINLLHSSPQSTLNRKLQNITLSDDEKSIIIDNLEVVENMLAGGMIKSEETTSDKDGYSTMYTITTTNLSGKQDSYKFYFSQTEIIDYDDDDDDLFDKDNEKEYALNGIVIFDNVEYKMTGNKEIEDDEMEMSFKVYKDQSNYVVIEQESENNEQGFEYTHYENGKKVFESEFEYEVGRNGKIEVEFEQKTTTSNSKYKFEYTIKDGKKYVIVKIKENGKTSTALIEIVSDEQGNIYYIFA